MFMPYKYCISKKPKILLLNAVRFIGSEKVLKLFCFHLFFLHRFVQFFLRLGCGKTSPDPRSQPVLLQFSVNGGLSWSLLQKFFYTNTSNQAELVALEVPLQARTTETRLRWWQPSDNGYFHSPWVIDKVISAQHKALVHKVLLLFWGLQVNYISLLVQHKCLIFFKF